MNKIKKYQMGAVLDLAPYSYYNPQVANAVQGIQTVLSKTVPHVTSAVQSIPTVLSAVAPYVTATGGALGAGALMGGGLYLLGNAQNTAVSGAMNRAAEAQAIRERAKAEQEWQVKNNHYNSIINDGGLKLSSGSIVYEYDPTSGTAYLQKDIPTVGTSYWKQNMRTGELFDPSVINYNGIALPVTVTGPKSGVVYNETPIKSEEGTAGVGEGAGAGTPSPSNPGGGENSEDERDKRIRELEEKIKQLENKQTPKKKNPFVEGVNKGWNGLSTVGSHVLKGIGIGIGGFALPALVGTGTYYVGKASGWWGNNKDNNSKENSNETQGYDTKSDWDW